MRKMLLPAVSCCLALLTVLLGYCAERSWAADADVALILDLKARGNEIPKDFLGLSFETYWTFNQNGAYFFSPRNRELLSLFNSLGIHSLRIGGNSADQPKNRDAEPADIDALFAFAKAGDIQVIYNLRLKELQSPESDVKLARYILEHYKPLLNSLTIGNEPDMFFKKFPEYRAAWEKVATAILASNPDAPLNGPSIAKESDWPHDFASQVALHKHVVLITRHAYPGGNGKAVPDPAKSRENLLSPKMLQKYEAIHKTCADASKAAHLPFKLEETNSLYNGGGANVSNSFASALWALDYMYWWAMHDARGLNFHTGCPIRKSDTDMPGGYDMFHRTPNGFFIHSLGYAFKAFHLAAADGGLVPVRIDPEKKLNLTAYAVRSRDKTLFITIINKENGPGARAAEVTLKDVEGFSHADEIVLSAPGNDISVLTGESLGGSKINSDGSWNGKWAPVVNGVTLSRRTLHVEPSSAMIVRLVK